jgi:hypothetical protein
MRLVAPLLSSLLAAAVLAAGPATGFAATTPWSAPAAIPGAPDSQPLLAQDANGPQAVYWETLQLTQPPTGASINSFVSPLGPGLQPGPATLVSPPLNTGSAAAHGNGRVALDEEQVGVASGPLAGPFTVHKLPMLIRAIAADQAGDIAAVIEQCDPSGCDPAAPEVAIARHGQAFGAPIRLDRKGSDFGTGLAIDQHGRILVAWDRDRGVYARFVSSGGRLGSIVHLGKETGPSTFDVVLSADGRAAVGWTSQEVDEGEATSPFTANLALAGTNGHFGRAQRLGTVPVRGEGSYIPYGGLAVALPAGHSGLVAWSDYKTGHFTVAAAPIKNGRAGTPQTVSEPGTDTILAAAAEGAHGQAVILLLPGRAGANPSTPTPDALDAVTHPAGTVTFGPPEQILPAPADVDGASVAIDPASGGVFATWRDVGSPIGWSVRTPLG